MATSASVTPPVALTPDRVSERPRLDLLLDPRSIAVVGASDKSGHAATSIGFLRDWGYEGRVFPINPNRTEVLGLPCYPNLASTPEVPELALVLVGRDAVMGVLREAQKAGVWAAIVIAGDYAENPDPVGREMQDEMAAFSRETGFLVEGPNCLGFINVRAKAAPFCAPLDSPVLTGKLAIVAQSGGNVVAFVSSAYERNLGLSYLISTGNEACLQLPDYIEFLVKDTSTRVICAYIEGIPDPKRFHAAALAAARAGKPIVAIKVGRSERGREVALAHTGSLSGSDEFVDALFADARVIRAESIDDALDKCSLFAQLEPKYWPRGRRVALFTIGGGAAAIFADLAAKNEISLPPLPETVQASLSAAYPPTVTVKNPIDLPGWHLTRHPELLQMFVDECGRSGAYDAVAVGILPAPVLFDAARSVEQTQAAIERPVIAVTPSAVSASPLVRDFMKASSAPVVLGIDRFMAAFGAAIAYRELQPREHAVAVTGVPAGVLDTLAEAKLRGSDALDPEATWKVLSAYGLPMVAQGLARTSDEAVHIADRLRYPVALKLASPGHKTELGGVRLGLRHANDVREAFKQLSGHGNAEHASDPARVVVQAMAPAGVEIFLGVSNTQYGYPPAVLVGFGGILVELIKDVVLRFAPLTPDDALQMVRALRGHAILDGFRGGPKADLRTLVDVIERLSRLAVDLRSHVAEVDVNPLILGEEGKGGHIVDARIVLRTD